MPTAPYGSWPSPVSPASLVEASVRVGQVDVVGDRVWWVEGRPEDAGRQVLVSVSLSTGGEATDAIPAGFSVRTSVHEYGGRCWAIHGETLAFSNWEDQRLWLTSTQAGSAPVPLTAAPDPIASVRYADPVIHPSGSWLACVRETHHRGREAVNDLVAIDLDSGGATVLVAGHDFFSSPRFSPGGDRLAWIAWDHPAMPWDATRLWVASVGGQAIGPARVVAGGADESVTQPRWSPDGRLHYVSDRTGWWNIYVDPDAPLAPMEAECAGPDWNFGNSSYGFASDGTLVVTWTSDGSWHLGRIGPDGRLQETATPFTAWSSVHPLADGAVAVAASPTRPAAVVRIRWDSARVDTIRSSRATPAGADTVSVPVPVDFPTAGGTRAHALYYPPTNGDWSGPEGERPPVLVVIHGGPTSAAEPVFDPAVQYWTTRGIAVAAVNHRGSSGYGRAFRRQLDGAWGVADVEDCAAAVRWLAAEGRVDGSKALIRGGSAGGFTTLAALAFTDTFAAGASLYGVADLETLARDTHKFEARYLDGLVGPWPAAAEVYRQRSPIQHVDRIDVPVILFQGLDDKVVPPSQSEAVRRALLGRGVPVTYMAFEGEQHGFRRAETVMAVAAAELEFYGRVLGFEPDLSPRSG